MRILTQSLAIGFVTMVTLFPFMAICAEAADSPWTTMAPMPARATFDFRAATVKEKIYVMVGAGWPDYRSANEEYDPETNSWTTKASMPTNRNYFAIATYQDKIYCIGGSYGGINTGVNEVYNPATNTWETKTPMPNPRHALCANVVNGKIYLIGGLVQHPMFPNEIGTYISTNINEVYDPASDSWTTKAPIPYAAARYVSAVVNSKIYVISGSCTQIYNPETDTWSFGAAPPFSIDTAGGATVAGVTPQRVYVIGGRISGLEVAYNQAYNPENDSWSLGAPLPTARYGLAVAVAKDKIYAIGGWIGYLYNAVRTYVNEQYDPLKDKAVPSVPSTSPQPPQGTLTPEPEHEPFSTLLVAVASVVIVAVVGAGLLVYFKKRRR